MVPNVQSDNTIEILLLKKEGFKSMRECVLHLSVFLSYKQYLRMLYVVEIGNFRNGLLCPRSTKNSLLTFGRKQ